MVEISTMTEVLTLEINSLSPTKLRSSGFRGDSGQSNQVRKPCLM